jgi:SAM-dependent methyltransferase
MNQTCPLCHAQTEMHAQHGALQQRLHHCPNCELIFVASNFWPSIDTERIRYLQHNNSPEEPGYVSFLNRAVAPTLPFLKPKIKALDFGCGPGPAIEVLLKEQDISCVNYDPIFFPEWPLDDFDAIFATECIEHFHKPEASFRLMLSVLKSGGILTLMTHPYDDHTDFTKWYYTKDETHVSFYHHKTFEFIAENFNLKLLDVPEKRVYIFRKK